MMIKSVLRKVMPPLGLMAALAALSASVSRTNGPTSAEVVARCAEAMGGRAKIDQWKTLRVGAVYPDHGDKPLFVEIRRPNMSYTPGSFLVFDGQRACLLKGVDYRSAPKLMETGDLIDFDVEVGYFFPAFFEFPSEYLGSETVDGRLVHKIRPALPHGAEMVYAIDAATWLPYKTTVHLTIGGQAFDAERVFSDYRSVDGILYPHRFTYPSRDRRSVIQGRVASVEINPVLDEAHFTIPKDIK